MNITSPWWTWYALSLGAYIVFPIVMGGTWTRRIVGAIAMLGLWCLLQFTDSGRMWICYNDTYGTTSCYFTPKQPHLDPPKHWWRNTFN